MATWTALTTLADRGRADALGMALEGLEPTPSGVGVFEIEDDSGTWEVGGYFTDAPDEIGLALLAAGTWSGGIRHFGAAGDRLGRPCAAGIDPGRGGTLFCFWVA